MRLCSIQTRLVLLLCLAILVGHAAESTAQNTSPLDRLQRAAEMIRKGQLTNAEFELNVVLKRAPHEANASNLLGVVRAQQHRASEAEQLFLSAIEVNKTLLGAYLNVGQLYVTLGKRDRALWAFTEAAKLAPNQHEIDLQLARLYAELHDDKQALESLERIPRSLWTTEHLYLLVKSHLALGHTGQAKELVAPLKRANAVPGEVASGFAAAFAERGLPDQAIEILEVARKQSPDSFAVLYNLGASYFQEGDWHQASECYSAALALKPNDVATLQALARVAREQGETEKALSYLVRARKLTPDSPSLLYEFGWTALQQKLFFDALQALSRLHEIQPNEPSYLYAFAVARLLNGEPELALPIINRYLELKPQDPRGHYMLGVALYTLQQLPQARAALMNSLKIAVHPDTQYYLALVAYNEGDLAQASALSQDALKADANFSAAHTLLGTIYVKQGDFPAARTQLERATELDPTDLKAHYQLGVVYSRLDNKARAQEMFAKANALRKVEREQDATGLRLIEPPP